MATGADVLGMLIPEGGWIITGEDYTGIQFLNCDAITQEQYEAGFAQFDAWKASKDEVKAAAKAALLERLGINAEEAALLLS